MLQFSVYIRPCPSHESYNVHLNRVKALIPPEGSVSLIRITDKQFGEIANFYGNFSLLIKDITKRWHQTYVIVNINSADRLKRLKEYCLENNCYTDLKIFGDLSAKSIFGDADDDSGADTKSIITKIDDEDATKQYFQLYNFDKDNTITADISSINNYDVLRNLVDTLIINDEVLLGEGKIISSIGSKKFYVSDKSFFQVNKELTVRLYDEVKRVVEEKKPKKVLDLYCGTGTIGIYVSDFCEEVIGVDYSKSGINDANANKELNKVKNIKFICS